MVTGFLAYKSKGRPLWAALAFVLIFQCFFKTMLDIIRQMSYNKITGKGKLSNEERSYTARKRMST